MKHRVELEQCFVVQSSTGAELRSTALYWSSTPWYRIVLEQGVVYRVVLEQYFVVQSSTGEAVCKVVLCSTVLGSTLQYRLILAQFFVVPSSTGAGLSSSF